MRIVKEALTFDDVLLQPGYSEVLPREVEAENAEVEAQIAKKTLQAEMAIADAKSAAVSNLNEVAAGAAETIVKELIGGKLTKAEVNKAVSKALAS